MGVVYNIKGEEKSSPFYMLKNVRGTIIPFSKTTLSSNASIYLRLPYGVKPVNEKRGKFTECDNDFQICIDE